MSNLGEPTIAELSEHFRERWCEAQGLARRSVEVAWQAGRALTEIKARLAHGQWQPWLEGEKIRPRTARQLMQLARVENGEICRFETVDAALRSLPKSEPKPATDPKPVAVVHPALDQQQSDDALAAKLESELHDKEGEIEGLQERIAIMEESADPDLRAAMQKINNLQELVRTLKSQVGSWQSKCADLQREKRSLKRKLKALEAEAN